MIKIRFGDVKQLQSTIYNWQMEKSGFEFQFYYLQARN